MKMSKSNKRSLSIADDNRSYYRLTVCQELNAKTTYTGLTMASVEIALIT